MTECVACHQPLSVEIEFESDDEDIDMEGGSSSAAAGPSTSASTKETVPDDVHLNCGCHFHWSCLLDAYSMDSCPYCSKTLTSTNSEGVQQILCNLNNEGGLQEGLDILPLLTEESYLKAYPEDRKARAFLEFCREGDVQAIVGMLKPDPESDPDEEKDYSIDFLWYQDPIGDMQSGLHAAVAGQSREVAWLLLLLASNYDLMSMPPEVFQEASALGIMRGDMEGRTDIRSMRDAQGRTAEDLANEVGGVWHGWAGTGRLAT